MPENQFSVSVPNPLQALMLGEQSYKDQKMQSVREQAAQDVMQGGDPKNALARLLSVGDDKGAATLSSVINSQQQNEFQNKSLAETSRFHDMSNQQSQAQLAATTAHYRALEGQGAATLAETIRQHTADQNKPIHVGSDLSGDIFVVRTPEGGYKRLDPRGIPSTGGPSAQAPQASPQPQSVSPQAPSGASPNPAPLPAPGDLSLVDPKTNRREEYLKSLPPEIQEYIKKVANYEIDPRTSSTKGGKREQLMSAVAQYDPTYDQNTFPARGKAVKDFSTGTQGNAVRSFDVAVDHLGTLRELAVALDNGDSRTINMLKNKFKDQFGYEAPSNFDAAKSIVAAEITKAIVGGNSALADREELRAPLNNSKSFGQLAGVIDKVYTPLMAGQLKGLKKQYEDTTGRKDFDNRLREGTRAKLIGGEQAATPASVQPGTTSTGVRWKVIE